ncbi:MAG: UDP-glucose dehydrogenase family protein [Polyangiales bacterium]
MQVAVIGCGYVGLVTGAGFAETGASVRSVDIDEERIRQLEAGQIPIFEPGLSELVARNTQAGRLSFSSDVAQAVAEADVVFIAVGTPPRPDGAADLRAVDRVAETIRDHAGGRTVVALKSTVPVGTAVRVSRILQDSPHPIHVVSNPEFLKEGDAVNDFLRPDRIVIGCHPEDKHARDLMQRLYHPVALDRDRIVWMSCASAELTKYVANTMLAMRISMMNEVALLCEKVGADAHEVRVGVGSDSRIGGKFLYAGPGYGGSCFPKDVKALVQTGRDHGLELELAAVTDRVNDRQKGVVVRKLRQHFDGNLRGKRIVIWGLSFKPRTDDIREAPALHAIDTLLAEGAQVAAHDPCAAAHVEAEYKGKVSLHDDAYSAAEGADALVLMTEWRQYQNPDFRRLKKIMARPLLIDARNIWNRYGLRAQGFTYEGIGVQGS